MASINLGGITSNNGKTRLNGMLSGLDTEALIKATVDAKMVPVKKLEDKVTLNNEKISALQDLKTLFKDLRTSADQLRAAPGYSQSQNSQLLSTKKVILSSNTISNPINYMDISASGQVDKQIFDIKIDSIAKAKIEKTSSFADLSSSATDISGLHNNGRFTAGTFQINTTDITLTAGDTLADVAGKINALKSQTNVSATIIQPSIGQYSIQLKSLSAGIDNAYTITDNNSVLNDVLTQIDTTVQEATDSQIRINNSITVSRPTNTITDFIDGLTIKVFNPSSDNITVDIDYDQDIAVQSIVDFAEKYNAAMNFINEQQAKSSEGKYLETAKIQKSAFVSDAKFNLSNLLTSTINSNDGYEYLSTIGVSFPNSEESLKDPSLANNLFIDSNKLANTVHNNFDNVRKLLEFQYSSTSPNFLITDRSNNIAENTSFSINVDVDRAEGEIAKITYGSTTINAAFSPNNANDLSKGGFIKGPDNSPFAGFEFQYTGSGNNETSDISASQGIMDKMYNQLDYYLSNNYSNLSGAGNTNDAFDFEISTINEEQISAAKQIEDKKARIEKDREAMINKFTALEASIAKSNSILEMLKIQQDAMKQ